MSSEKPKLKMCEYQSQTFISSQQLAVGIVGKGEGINLFLHLPKWVGGHTSYPTSPHHLFLQAQVSVEPAPHLQSRHA